MLPPLWEAGLRIGGPEAEYRAAANFLDSTDHKKSTNIRNAASQRVLLDLSCGTGFVGQRFAVNSSDKSSSSGGYDYVFALDYSPQRLGKLVSSIQRQQSASTSISSNIFPFPFFGETLAIYHSKLTASMPFIGELRCIVCPMPNWRSKKYFEY